MARLFKRNEKIGSRGKRLTKVGKDVYDLSVFEDDDVPLETIGIDDLDKDDKARRTVAVISSVSDVARGVVSVFALIQVALMAFIILLFFLIMCMGSCSSTAEARTLASPSTDIVATVNADGSVLVNETRSFAFNGSYNGIYYDIDTSNGVSAQVVSVKADGQSCTESSSGNPNTYSLEHPSSDTLRVKIYTPHADTTGEIQIDYVFSNLIDTYSDVAELYWMFIPPGWEMDSDNVTCTVNLPVPDGVTPNSSDIRAWGHGDLLGEVDVTSNGAYFSIPNVRSGEFAEARVTFPSSWMSVQPTGGEHLSSVLAEEERWASDANAYRDSLAEKERSAAVGSFLTGTLSIAPVLGLGAFSIVTAVIQRRQADELLDTEFDGEYWRDVPCKYNPLVAAIAVEGPSLDDDKDGSQFAAALVRLIDQGAITVDITKDKRGRPEGYVFHKSTGEPKDEIDQAVMDVLFEKFDDCLMTPDELNMESLAKFAKRFPLRYRKAMADWHNVAVDEAIDLGFLEDDVDTSFKPYTVSIIILVAYLIVFVFMASFFDLFSPPIIIISVLLVFLFVALSSAIGKNKAPGSAESREIRAKTAALKRWLNDFTTLDEALPTDVVLWNNLLVYAVLLGVADKVLRGLKTKMPDVYQSDALRHARYLYMGHMGIHSPMREIRNLSRSANEAYNHAVAESRRSSGSGGGGGFSGGGGGGHGGGGGGGGF